jgi:hypothetical protein
MEVMTTSQSAAWVSRLQWLKRLRQAARSGGFGETYVAGTKD